VEPSDRPIASALKKIGTNEMRAANVDKWSKTTDAVRNRGGGWANTFVILDGIRNAVHGNIAGIGEDMVVRGAFGVGKSALANLLERPEVVKFFTEPTAKQISEIPESMRGDLQQVAQQALKQGIKVDPKLMQAIGMTAGVAPKKQIADFLK
jgi:hypothetical protein